MMALSGKRTGFFRKCEKRLRSCERHTFQKNADFAGGFLIQTCDKLNINFNKEFDYDN